MTNEEAKKMLKAKLECFKNEISGINHDCNMRLCDGCSLNYEQGNMGEQKEALEMAIKALGIASCIKEKCAYCPHCENCDVDDDTLAIKALEQERYYKDLAQSYERTIIKLTEAIAEQQSGEDCISRQAVKEMLTEEWTKYMPMELDMNLSFVLEKISELPSVTPKTEALKQTRPKGKWKYTEMGWFVVCNCSECGFQIDADEANNFCPYCGADMRGEKE